MEATAAVALMELFEDHQSSTPEHLAQIAKSLSPGGVHNGAALLLRLLNDPVLAVTNPRLLAAAIYANWHGGKAGFQFLPDPATIDRETYQDEADIIANVLADGGPPQAFLLSEDRAFFDALPSRFTVYRGVAGVSAEIANAGLCWTIDRKVADWFANRSARLGDGAPVTLTARIQKSDVLLVNAVEREVACQPSRARQIKTLQQFDQPV